MFFNNCRRSQTQPLQQKNPTRAIYRTDVLNYKLSSRQIMSFSGFQHCFLFLIKLFSLFFALSKVNASHIRAFPVQLMISCVSSQFFIHSQCLCDLSVSLLPLLMDQSVSVELMADTSAIILFLYYPFPFSVMSEVFLIKSYQMPGIFLIRQ